MKSILEFLVKSTAKLEKQYAEEVENSKGEITVNGYFVKTKKSNHYVYWYELWKYIMKTFAPDYAINRRDAFLFLLKISPTTFSSFDDYTSTAEYVGLKGPHCFLRYGNKLIALEQDKWKKLK